MQDAAQEIEESEKQEEGSPSAVPEEGATATTATAATIATTATTATTAEAAPATSTPATATSSATTSLESTPSTTAVSTPPSAATTAEATTTETTTDTTTATTQIQKRHQQEQQQQAALSTAAASSEAPEQQSNNNSSRNSNSSNHNSSSTKTSAAAEQTAASASVPEDEDSDDAWGDWGAAGKVASEPTRVVTLNKEDSEDSDDAWGDWTANKGNVDGTKVQSKAQSSQRQVVKAKSKARPQQKKKNSFKLTGSNSNEVAKDREEAKPKAATEDDDSDDAWGDWTASAAENKPKAKVKPVNREKLGITVNVNKPKKPPTQTEDGRFTAFGKNAKKKKAAAQSKAAAESQGKPGLVNPGPGKRKEDIQSVKKQLEQLNCWRAGADFPNESSKSASAVRSGIMSRAANWARANALKAGKSNEQLKQVAKEAAHKAAVLLDRISGLPARDSQEKQAPPKKQAREDERQPFPSGEDLLRRLHEKRSGVNPASSGGPLSYGPLPGSESARASSSRGVSPPRPAKAGAPKPPAKPPPKALWNPKARPGLVYEEDQKDETLPPGVWNPQPARPSAGSWNPAGMWVGQHAPIGALRPGPVPHPFGHPPIRASQALPHPVGQHPLLGARPSGLQDSLVHRDRSRSRSYSYYTDCVSDCSLSCSYDHSQHRRHSRSGSRSDGRSRRRRDSVRRSRRHSRRGRRRNRSQSRGHDRRHARRERHSHDSVRRRSRHGRDRDRRRRRRERLPSRSQSLRSESSYSYSGGGGGQRPSRGHRKSFAEREKVRRMSRRTKKRGVRHVSCSRKSSEKRLENRKSQRTEENSEMLEDTSLKKPAALANSAAENDELRVWLEDVDQGRGILLIYLPKLSETCQSVAEVLEHAFVEGYEESQSIIKSVSPDFFTNIGVKSLGHRLILAKGILATRSAQKSLVDKVFAGPGGVMPVPAKARPTRAQSEAPTKVLHWEDADPVEETLQVEDEQGLLEDSEDPYASDVAQMLLKGKGSPGDTVGDGVGDGVGDDSVGVGVGDGVGDAVGDDAVGDGDGDGGVAVGGDGNGYGVGDDDNVGDGVGDGDHGGNLLEDAYASVFYDSGGVDDGGVGIVDYLDDGVGDGEGVADCFDGGYGAGFDDANAVAEGHGEPAEVLEFELEEGEVPEFEQIEIEEIPPQGHSQRSAAHVQPTSSSAPLTGASAVLQALAARKEAKRFSVFAPSKKPSS